MGSAGWNRWAAGSGAAAVLIYATAAVVAGSPPPFDASAPEIAADLEARRTRIQVAAVLHAAWPPLLLWFLVTVLERARGAGRAAAGAATLAFGCGIVFVALFLADVAALAVGALRPGNLAAAPELAVALHDFEWLLQGTASLTVSAMLAALGVACLRDGAWPSWVGRLALVAAVVYALRVGTLTTVSGPFAGDGLLGLWLPVFAVAGWFLVASAVLARRAAG